MIIIKVERQTIKNNDSEERFLKTTYRNFIFIFPYASSFVFFCVTEIFLECFKWLYLYFPQFVGYFRISKFRAKVEDT